MSPARAQRTHLIRSRIAAGAIALFVALFGVMGVRLALGDDPGLAHSSSAAPADTSTTTSGGDDEDQVTTSDDSSRAVAPVTTSQS